MMDIAIAGATGRMGKGLVAAVDTAADMRLSLALAREGHEALGIDSGEYSGVAVNGVPIIAATDARSNFDVLIDFSAPEALAEHLELCRAQGAALIWGTTATNSLETHNKNLLSAAAEHLAILEAPNTSLVTALSFQLVKEAASVLSRKFGADKVDMEVVETHHRNKKDAPSGTARRIGEIMADAAGRSLDKDRRDHQAEDGKARPDGAIGISTIRGGGFVDSDYHHCQHAAMFFLQGTELCIRFDTRNPSPFINGALDAARWLNGREAGLYRMENVLKDVLDEVDVSPSPAEYEESAQIKAVPVSQRHPANAPKVHRRSANSPSKLARGRSTG